ncbi:MAG: hypothetical protein BWY82_01295 [Verrucomicrobia bacterium ADurb.Bin474]|nr:MAG: hypothetical protein BWY82_01295 [Verrucomicrobia bacterium ADurb.Bin474]
MSDTLHAGWHGECFADDIAVGESEVPDCLESFRESDRVPEPLSSEKSQISYLNERFWKGQLGAPWHFPPGKGGGSDCGHRFSVDGVRNDDLSFTSKVVCDGDGFTLIDDLKISEPFSNRLTCVPSPQGGRETLSSRWKHQTKSLKGIIEDTGTHRRRIARKDHFSHAPRAGERIVADLLEAGWKLNRNILLVWNSTYKGACPDCGYRFPMDGIRNDNISLASKVVCDGDGFTLIDDFKIPGL